MVEVLPWASDAATTSNMLSVKDETSEEHGTCGDRVIYTYIIRALRRRFDVVACIGRSEGLYEPLPSPAPNRLLEAA
eukprot:scaffold208556_cov20-Prasinocladus_malaysianus.AAC.1